MKRYEYNQLYVSFQPESDGTNHIDKLNHFGIGGWDLVSSIKIDEHNVCYVFKREIQQEKMLLNEVKGVKDE